MSKYVDVDKCPCGECKTILRCGEDVIHPYCDRYEEWLKGEDVVPVRHGHWVDLFDGRKLEFKYYECSVCGISQRREYNYCPMCGAKMDEVRE